MIKQSDSLRLDDTFKNKIRVFDKETGKFLFERDNLVTQSGRIFTMESITNTLAPTTTNTTNRRQLLYFTIGHGGVNAGEPDQPIAPTSDNTDASMLATQVAFTTANSGGQYCNLSDGNYYGKYFEVLSNANSWSIDSGQNKVTHILSMIVSPTDARGEAISEIGIHFGYRSGGGSVVSDSGLFSRITFASKYLLGNNSFEILYYIYA